MKTFAEKLSNLHQQLMLSWQELMRDVHKYSTEQQKKHREVAYDCVFIMIIRSTLRQSRPNKAGLKCTSVCAYEHTYVRPSVRPSVH